MYNNIKSTRGCSCGPDLGGRLLLRHDGDDGDDDSENDQHYGGDDQLHLHVLPPHLLLQLVRVPFEHSSLLLQLLYE